ncbi:coiled-coil domain-containing protein 102B isoform X2 [Nannospalax galili]|uniref:coiled-coil domain-containing protein 102B isoform X2 n=1 Tax=Nannospalax galili TaxID=1026970 RepID=UPI00111C807F|nr:coiled-coil domain-containing protein 102B isoform X2 [Nannospalax galili]
MNFDSIHRLIEETQIFQMQQSTVKSRCEVAPPASSPQDVCSSFLPIHGVAPPHAHNTGVPSFTTNKWDICEELRLRELDEVKARAAQMEKTMRWWSDCTANWREKWSKVRAERNSAREEGRQLRLQLEMAMKELSALKKQQSPWPQKEVAEGSTTQDLELPSGSNVSYEHRDHFQHHSHMGESAREGLMRKQFPEEQNTPSKENCVDIYPPRIKEEIKSNLDCMDLCKNGGFRTHNQTPRLKQQAGHLPLLKEVTETPAVQVHLFEFQKILWKEREIRAALEKEIEQLESALSLWKWKYEELERSKVDICDQHENENEGTSGNVQEESKPQKSKDGVIHEQKKLQAENTLEWNTRELLETEKQKLEKENRKLKFQIKEMERLLERQHRSSTNLQHPDFKASQMELEEKRKPRDHYALPVPPSKMPGNCDD